MHGSRRGAPIKPPKKEDKNSMSHDTDVMKLFKKVRLEDGYSRSTWPSYP